MKNVPPINNITGDNKQVSKSGVNNIPKLISTGADAGPSSARKPGGPVGNETLDLEFKPE